MIYAGFALYLANLAVGITARVRRIGFGRVHHGLYAVVFVTALAAAAVDRSPWLILTLGSLATLPLAPATSRLHPTLATIGLLGYVGALLH